MREKSHQEINSELNPLRTTPPHQPTDAEKKLWRTLRSRQLNGLKFKRQVPIPPYVADFYCHSAKLIIEIDGSQHIAQQAEDTNRSKFLNRHGYRVIRFNNNEVLTNLEGVIATILQELNEVAEIANPPSS